MSDRVKGTRNIILIDKDIRRVVKPDGKQILGAMNKDGLFQLTMRVDKGDLFGIEKIKHTVSSLMDGMVYLVEEV